ncbi:MAG: MarR family transcriptional regulator [Kiritimatiellia bacterium]
MDLKNELGLDQAIKTMEHECLLNIVYTGMMINKSAYRYFSRYGITETQFNVLMLLKYALSEGLSQVALSRRLVVNKADMTGLVDRLERKKLVERSRDGADRRINLVKLTRQGRDMLLKVEKVYFTEVNRLFKGCSKTEIRAIIRGLELIRKNLRESMDS